MKMELLVPWDAVRLDQVSSDKNLSCLDYVYVHIYTWDAINIIYCFFVVTIFNP